MSCSVYDGIELEKRGIPALAIHTSAFTGSAHAHAVAYGRPDYEPIIVQHPIAGLTPQDVAGRAEAIMPSIVAHLLGAEGETPPSEAPSVTDPLARISESLAEIRSGFNADGADLEVVSATTDSATVRLVITPETCLECIVPKPVLQQIVESLVRKAFPELTKIELIDPREAVAP